MYFSKKIFEVEHSKVQAKRQADYLKSLLIQRQLAKEIRLFNIGGYLIDRWFKTTQSYTKGYLKTAWKRENSTFTIQVITSIFYIVCITIISSSAIRETLTIGIFVALIQAVQKFQQSLETLSTQMAFYIQHSNHVGAAYQFIERVIPETKQTSTLTDTLFSIEFKHVSFRYPGAHDDSLKDLSFVINEGERVALLGENGAGKSTIAKLILGLYKPTKGKIYINGQDIESVNIQEMRNRITAVFQDFVRYQLRFRENIGFGEIYCIHDDNKLYDAASKVDMDAFIRSTSKAIDSQLGNQFTHGIDLSGGQWQRLAMARSYLRNAAFIMMDEPTAALDPIAEVEVYKQFMKIADIKTTLFISHRVGLARLADRIFILKDGRLIEEGHHERLIKAGGEYAEFFKTQAKWYEDVPTG